MSPRGGGSPRDRAVRVLEELATLWHADSDDALARKAAGDTPEAFRAWEREVREHLAAAARYARSPLHTARDRVIEAAAGIAEHVIALRVAERAAARERMRREADLPPLLGGIEVRPVDATSDVVTRAVAEELRASGLCVEVLTCDDDDEEDGNDDEEECT